MSFKELQLKHRELLEVEHGDDQNIQKPFLLEVFCEQHPGAGCLFLSFVGG